MEATLFYITNTLLLLTLIGAAMYIAIVGRKVNDEKLHFSRRSYIAFYIALAVTVATTYDQEILPQHLYLVQPARIRPIGADIQYHLAHLRILPSHHGGRPAPE